ncbi:MAG: hypothetical protein ACI8QZ_003822 [Chlamydiales bacterium]|jgi:hypothetical protein
MGNPWGFAGRKLNPRLEESLRRHFGIGALFGKVESPFRGYNLFCYVHVLATYGAARKSPKDRQACGALEARLVDGRVVVENLSRGLASLAFCREGDPSHRATMRYREIARNVPE